MMDKSWISEIHDFWFNQLDKADWFKQSDDVDEEITERFGEIWEELRQHPASAFMDSAQMALSAIIMFDQFPRNMFREKGDAFSTDHLARQIADEAIERGYGNQLTEAEQHFLYIPYMHSEDLSDQNKSVLFFTELGDSDTLEFATKHRKMIEKFGRFPHRNKVLGRRTTPEEQEAIDSGFAW